MEDLRQSEAYLSHSGEYTCFRFRDHVIRFHTPRTLERYTKVREWDHGYLVVMAKYRNRSADEEEYIDLVPIPNHLYFDADSFLAPIERVTIRYDS